MQFPIVKEFKDDILNENPENRIYQEPFLIEPGEGTRVLAPRHAPFFVKSLKITTLKGEPLYRGKDWEIFRLMGRLTDVTAQPVACLIKFLRNDITSGLMTYDTVGEFSLLDNSLLSLITAAMNDDRPVYWNNLTGKPIVFPPKLHPHSLLYDILGFQDTLDLIGYIIQYLKDHQKGWIEIRVEHYYNLIKNYSAVFGDMLRTLLNRHIDSYNPHGLTALQVLLEKVDNFATASPSQALQPRNDLKVTPAGLKAIVETYGYNAGDFLEVGVLPMSQFGNTNFIPPSIDGSFEGLGSQAETCAYAMENDGSIVAVGNRMDGRNLGLYFSVMKNYDDPNKASQSYSAYRYNHQKFIQDSSLVDRVVNGSNGQAMLVADSTNQRWYIGVTNNTMNPAKHVYSPIDMGPIKRTFSASAFNLTDNMHQLSIAVVGDWVYIFFGSPRPGPDDQSEEYFGGSLTFRHIFRVSFSGIKNLVTMTPQPVNVNFQDLDGTQWNNTNVWRWGQRFNNGNKDQVTRFLHSFVPFSDQQPRACYTQTSLATPNPNKPGYHILKLLSYFYCAKISNGKYTYAFIEVSYEINPDSPTWTKLSQTPMKTINFDTGNYPGDSDLTNTWDIIVTGDTKCGVVVMDDLTVISSGCLKTGGFPWYTKLIKPQGVVNRADLLSRNWHDIGIASAYTPYEPVVPPTNNNVAPRPPMHFPGKEVFMSNRGDNSDALGLYVRTVSGKLAAQSNVTNRYIGNLISRPLTNNIRLLNVPPHLGGAIVAVPSAALDSYGIEVAQSAFCMNSQRRYADRTQLGARWTDSGGLDDVLVIDTHTFLDESDGSTSLVPGREIIYPAAIVNQLKQQVENLASLNSSAKVWVSICDPNGQLTAKFGWLPVIVMVTYAEKVNFSRRHTLMTIAPTYSQSGNRVTVTGFTVLDKAHDLYEGSASGQLSNGWGDSWITGNGGGPDVRYNRDAQRCLYYLNGNALSIYFDPAIQSGAFSNVVGHAASINYDDRTTQRWSRGVLEATQVNIPPHCVSQDNGITLTYEYPASTGGAAIIARASPGGKPIMLASTYPETGWVVFFQSAIDALFRGKVYTLAKGLVDLRDIDPSPGNKTFYIYAVLRDGKPVYEVTSEKRLESDYQLWVATAVTNSTQIISVDRFNVLALDGHRISEVKRGNSIPASSGLVSEEGQIPWIYQREVLP